MTDDYTDLTFGNMSIDEMSRRLVDDPSNRPKCTEHDWVYYWLPLFIGLIEVKDSADGKSYPPMMDWTRVARSAFQEVDVINEKGETLFTVPPLLRSITVGQKNVRVPLSAMLVHVASLRDVGRVKQADIVLKDYINSNLEIEADVFAEIRIWNSIFERYEPSKHLVVDIEALLSSTKETSNTDKPADDDSNNGKETDFDEFQF